MTEIILLLLSLHPPFPLRVYISTGTRPSSIHLLPLLTCLVGPTPWCCAPTLQCQDTAEPVSPAPVSVPVSAVCYIALESGFFLLKPRILSAHRRRIHTRGCDRSLLQACPLRRRLRAATAETTATNSRPYRMNLLHHNSVAIGRQAQSRSETHCRIM